MADPRAHRHAREVDGNRIRYSCGCLNEIEDSGVLRSVSKCKTHLKERRSPEFLRATYYEDLGCIVDGVPQCAHYLEELGEVLGGFPEASDGKRALEIGCGCSMYAPGLLARGYHYHGLEPSSWAAKWTESTFDVQVFECDLDAFTQGGYGEDGDFAIGGFSLILAAHSLEHMPDAPRAIRKCARLLDPGGELWVIVPDDEDPLNPDHNFFFSEPSLRRCVESAGLSVVTLESRRRVEHEEFIYLRASKP